MRVWLWVFVMVGLQVSGDVGVVEPDVDERWRGWLLTMTEVRAVKCGGVTGSSRVG